MGRSPCCVKMGLKKGPWTPEEDHLLITYIRLHGHTNWRSLPKHAGLLRCGKSCRLRWTNYLRPDIKRGNFTPEEEDNIISLHQLLGNRWSAIAAKLSGRTDNEIKNVWHSRLKKKLPKAEHGFTTSATATTTTGEPLVRSTCKRARKSKTSIKQSKSDLVEGDNSSSSNNNNNNNATNNKDNEVINNNIDVERRQASTVVPRGFGSTQSCTSEISTVTSTSTSTSTSNFENDNICKENVEEMGKGKCLGHFTDTNDDFWMEVLSIEDAAMSIEDLSCFLHYDHNNSVDHLMLEPMLLANPNVEDDDGDFFWCNLLSKSNELLELSEML